MVSFSTLPLDSLNPELETAGTGRADKPEFAMLSLDGMFTI